MELVLAAADFDELLVTFRRRVTCRLKVAMAGELASKKQTRLGVDVMQGPTKHGLSIIVVQMHAKVGDQWMPSEVVIKYNP